MLGSIYAGVATPTEAPAIGVLGATIFAFINRQMTPKIRLECLVGAIKTNTDHAHRCRGRVSFPGHGVSRHSGRIDPGDSAYAATPLSFDAAYDPDLDRFSGDRVVPAAFNDRKVVTVHKLPFVNANYKTLKISP